MKYRKDGIRESQDISRSGGGSSLYGTWAAVNG